MNNKELLSKFAKGFASGGGVSLIAFLQTNGCKVDDLQAFGYSALLGFLSGGFHAVWNYYFTKDKPL